MLEKLYWQLFNGFVALCIVATITMVLCLTIIVIAGILEVRDEKRSEQVQFGR